MGTEGKQEGYTLRQLTPSTGLGCLECFHGHLGQLDPSSCDVAMLPSEIYNMHTQQRHKRPLSDLICITIDGNHHYKDEEIAKKETTDDGRLFCGKRPRAV